MSPALLPLFVVLWAPPPAAPVEGEHIETIEVTARRERRDARDETLAVDALRPADDPRPLADLGALLDRAPGLRVVRGGDPGRSQTVQLRGAGGHQVAVLLDDVPLNAARGAAVDLGTLPASMIESVHVVRGAAGAAYGSGAQGGALRLRTREAGEARVDTALRGGSFGLLQGEIGATVGGPMADGLAMVDGSRADGDFAYTDAQGRPGVRLNNDHRRVGSLLRGRLRVDGLQGTALLHGRVDERGEPGSDQRPDGDGRTARDQALAVVGLADADPQSRLAWHARAWWLQRRSTFSDPTEPPETVPAKVRDRTVGLRSFVEWHGFEGQRPSVAVDVRHDHARLRTPGEAVGEDRLGAALTAAWTFEAEDALRVGPIVRVDGLEGREPVVVPKLGVVWTPLDGAARLELRSNGGRLFRDPGFDELYVRGPGVRGDPTLRPEDGWGADLGARLVTDVGPLALEVDVMGFAQRYDRLILFVPTDAYTIRARDDFSAAVDGLELLLRAGWGPLAFEGTWLAQDARFTSTPQAPLPDRPAHRLLGMLTAEVGPLAPFVVGRWHGAVSVDRFGSRTRPGYALLDLGLSARLPLGFALAGELRNLLDARAFDLLQRPLPGRSFLLELSWRGG